MARTLTYFAIMSLFIDLFSLSRVLCVSSRPSGFALKIVHIDSSISPLYRENLSNVEHFKRNVEISTSRALYFQGTSDKTTIKLPLKYSNPVFTVELSLGTPLVQRTLVFDTGSNLTWTQCSPCASCFRQNQPLFDTKKSSSYKQMSSKHRLAKEFVCDSYTCRYRFQYYSGQFSSGIASEEDFTFKTSTGVPYRTNGLVFGCGIMNSGSFGTTNAVTGVLGMNKAPTSFARQLGGRIRSRFSYCLPNLKSNTKVSYLRFGDKAIMQTKNHKTSPFLNVQKNFNYILRLNDISINGRRLGLKRGTFPKGCLIDSGTAVSLIEKKAYSAIEIAVRKHFSKFKNIQRIYLGRGLKDMLCYSKTGSFSNFPNMTLHFQGADFDVPPENLFAVDKTSFCLELIASKSYTALGAYQQQNVRFLYDLDKDMLSFAKQDCSKDVAI